MEPRTWSRLQPILRDALRLPAARRSSFLRDACVGDEPLRAAIASLLAGDAATDALDAASTSDRQPVDDRASGSWIGPYELLDVLGEGGFGTVHRARQHEPVQRDVALKILKLGMDSRQVVARFEAERQTVAMMDHPWIAKVFDAGVTATGRPYFVMELVHGLPITDYCDRRQLTTRARIELVVKVCQAVQHAHQKGVIHRDLKPSNVLVEEVDGSAAPRVIDFGVAKATGRRADEQSLVTAQHQLLGTPEYMAPEQASGMQDVDTRADVYSLGVLLYELLTGTRPFDLRELLVRGYDVLLGHIRDVTPPKPSTRISSLGDARAGIAAQRGATPEALGRTIRGDLDWIVMRALEKERSRRYDSVGALADDLERFLRDEAVTAGPPGRSYRLRKFARRHRASIVAAALVFVALATTVVALAWAFVNVRDERDRANRETRAVLRTRDFMVDLFEAADPEQARGEVRTARQLLDIGARNLDQLDDRDDVQAVLRSTLGGVYLTLGEFAAAQPLLEAALESLERADEPDRRELARALHRLAVVHDAGLDQPERAEALAQRAVALWHELGVPELEAESLNILGTARWHRGDLAAAAATYRRARAIQRERFGPDDLRTTDVLTNLGSVELMSGDYEAAERTYQQVLTIGEAQPEPDKDFDHGTTLHLLAIVNESLGRQERAMAYEQRALAIREEVLGPDHWHVALSLTTLGDLYRAVDRAADAVPLLRRAVAIAERTWDAHPDLWWSQRGLARALIEVGELGEARRIAELQITALDELGEDVWLALAREILGTVQHRQGELAAAEASLRAALEAMDRTYDAADPDRIRTLRSLAEVLRDRGEGAEADRLDAEAEALDRG